MSTISSMAFFRTEAPSAQGFNIGAIVRGIGKVGGALLGLQLPTKGPAPTQGFVPTLPSPTAPGGPAQVLVGAIPAILKGRAMLVNALVGLGIDRGNAELMAGNPLGPALAFLEQLRLPANVVGQAQQLLIAAKHRRRRRINAFNPKAARRAGRRLESLSKGIRKLHLRGPARSIVASPRRSHRAGCRCFACKRSAA